MKTTWLADFAEKISITFEKFNPALFRLLATVLPYSTPLPVAWYTSRSAQTFLEFTPEISGVFVFGLEGMGILFTSLFVDSVIDWIRSRNFKTFALVAIFGVVVIAYVSLLVNLNVTLEQINNPDNNQALSQVITLMCFLPLLTGIGNGYYKWKLESKSALDNDKEYERSIAEKEAERRSLERRERNHLKYGKQLGQSATYPAETKSVAKQKYASDYKEEIWGWMDRYYSKYSKPPKVVEVWRNVLEKHEITYNSCKGYVSTQRTDWAQQNEIEL